MERETLLQGYRFSLPGEVHTSRLAALDGHRAGARRVERIGIVEHRDGGAAQFNTERQLTALPGNDGFLQRTAWVDRRPVAFQLQAFEARPRRREGGDVQIRLDPDALRVAYQIGLGQRGDRSSGSAAGAAGLAGGGSIGSLLTASSVGGGYNRFSTTSWYSTRTTREMTTAMSARLSINQTTGSQPPGWNG